jgi:hypothetical protein
MGRMGAMGHNGHDHNSQRSLPTRDVQSREEKEFWSWHGDFDELDCECTIYPVTSKKYPDIISVRLSLLVYAFTLQYLAL